MGIHTRFSKPNWATSHPGGGEKWILQKIRYFDSFYDQKTGNCIEQTGKNIYSHDIYIFVNLVKNIIIVKYDKLVRNNLYTCFKKKPLYWWNSVCHRNRND